jgi:hypothetical protein
MELHNLSTPIIGGRDVEVRRSSANDIHRTAKIEILPETLVTTRYFYEGTWSVAIYLSPIAVMSRTACIVAPLGAQDMPNRASTDGVVRNLPLVA